MPDETLIGLDVGTTSAKAVLFDAAGREVAAAEHAYGLMTPRPGWVEQDPDALWRGVVDVLRRVRAALPAGRNVQALALSTQCGSFLPVRAGGEPAYPFITWMDGRTEELVAQWRAAGREEEVRRTSGWLLHPGLPLPGIVWLRENRPEVFAAAERFLSVNDYLAFRLTGRYVTNPSCAGEMQLLDLASGTWSEALCEMAGIEPAQLSSLQPSGTVIGPLTATAAERTSLSPETLVINGGHDHCCEAAALGVRSAGRLLLTCGTAWVLTGVTESPAPEAVPAQMDLNPHVVPRRWTVSHYLGSFGASLDWWLAQTFQPPDKASRHSSQVLYRRLDEALQPTEPGAGGLIFLPPGAAQVGRETGGRLLGVRLNHSRGDMARALMEGAAFALRDALEQLRRAGQPVEQLWMAGGATRSGLWPRLLSDVSATPLHVTRYPHWSIVGAALLAGVGAGLFPAIDEAPAGFERDAKPLRPDAAVVAEYDAHFDRYQQQRNTMELTQ